MSLEEALKNSKGAPYRKPVIAVVCGVSNPITYKKESGEERQLVTVGLADNTMIVKCLVYDVSKLKDMKEGTTILILNSITKTTPQKCIVITQQTKVMKTKEVIIKDDVRKAAMELACPAVKEMSLADVKNSPVKVMCTTRAQIASAEIPREVLVKGVQTQIKEVQLKEGKERVKLTLWRDFSKIDLPVGNWVQFSNLTTQSFQDEISLSTTSRTTIKAITAPEENIEGNLIGFTRSDVNMLELALEISGDFPSYLVENKILAQALNCDEKDIENKLEQDLPSKICSTTQNGEIRSIQFEL